MKLFSLHLSQLRLNFNVKSSSSPLEALFSAFPRRTIGLFFFYSGNVSKIRSIGLILCLSDNYHKHKRTYREHLKSTSTPPSTHMTESSKNSRSSIISTRKLRCIPQDNDHQLNYVFRQSTTIDHDPRVFFSTGSDKVSL